jgi:GR25 family glycosyltransferase involved in LPS biosynthesis
MSFMPYVTKQIRACNEKIQKAQEILNNPHATHKFTVISQVEDATSHLLHAIDALAFAEKDVRVLLLYPILTQKIALDNVIDEGVSAQHLSKNFMESSKILPLGEGISSELSETLQPRGKLISEEGIFANAVNHFALGETEQAFTQVAKNYKSPAKELSTLLTRRWIHPKLKLMLELWVHNNNMLTQLRQQALVTNAPTPNNQVSNNPI